MIMNNNKKNKNSNNNKNNKNNNNNNNNKNNSKNKNKNKNNYNNNNYNNITISSSTLLRTCDDCATDSLCENEKSIDVSDSGNALSPKKVGVKLFSCVALIMRCSPSGWLARLPGANSGVMVALRTCAVL